MPLALCVKSIDNAAKLQRRASAQRAVECPRHQLPDRRLLCFLDDEEWQALKHEYGAENRGLYTPVAPDLFWRTAPYYVLERLSVDGRFFDDFIYLHGSTCSSV